jgi:DNA-binding NarL/FixJ family response regulator
MNNKRTRIVFVEDLRTVREAVNFLLSQQKGVEVIDEEVDLQNITSFISKHRIEAVILDLQLSLPQDSPAPNGFDLCALISEELPKVKLIAHSMYDNIETVNKFFAKGGHAFVSKNSGYEELVHAIQEVIEGRRYICEHTMKLARNPERFLEGNDDQLRATFELFTRTERNVLERIAKGYSTKQIAHQLEISEKTVETHRKHLFEKAAVKNVAELMAFVYSRRIVIE